MEKSQKQSRPPERPGLRERLVAMTPEQRVAGLREIAEWTRSPDGVEFCERMRQDRLASPHGPWL